jgi:hypothetical protein
VKGSVDIARATINNNIAFIRQDIANKGAAVRPIAMTEWNITGISPTNANETSIANGMQAVVLFCEMLNNNFGMSARWLVANWDADGMFYYKSPPDPGIPLWNPRPDFYYIYELQRVVGDHVLAASVTGTSTVYAYATRFISGHTGVVVVNDGSNDKVVRLDPQSIGVGARCYVYTLTGIDNSTWPQAVVVNGQGPSGTAWGPLDSLQKIPADAYPIGSSIVFPSPARSVEYILLDEGSTVLSLGRGESDQVVRQFRLDQNYPNPFNPTTMISWQIPVVSHVTLEIFDLLGRRIAILADAEQRPGAHSVRFDASRLAGGTYFYRIRAGSYVETKKFTLVK